MRRNLPNKRIRKGSFFRQIPLKRLQYVSDWQSVKVLTIVFTYFAEELFFILPNTLSITIL
jgi:hypothetical protein